MSHRKFSKGNEIAIQEALSEGGDLAEAVDIEYSVSEQERIRKDKEMVLLFLDDLYRKTNRDGVIGLRIDMVSIVRGQSCDNVDGINTRSREEEENEFIELKSLIESAKDIQINLAPWQGGTHLDVDIIMPGFVIEDAFRQNPEGFILEENNQLNIFISNDDNILCEVGYNRSKKILIKDTLPKHFGTEQYQSTADTLLGDPQKGEIYLDEIEQSPNNFLKEIVLYKQHGLDIQKELLNRYISVLKSSIRLTENVDVLRAFLGTVPKWQITSFESMTVKAAIDQLEEKQQKKFAQLLDPYGDMFLWALELHVLPEVQNNLIKNETHRANMHRVIETFSRLFLYENVETVRRKIVYAEHEDSKTSWPIHGKVICFKESGAYYIPFATGDSGSSSPDGIDAAPPLEWKSFIGSLRSADMDQNFVKECCEKLRIQYPFFQFTNGVNGGGSTHEKWQSFSIRIYEKDLIAQAVRSKVIPEEFLQNIIQFFRKEINTEVSRARIPK
ncbi:MAG: hypothetical protein KBD15_02330 [Candidatus Magasanikbacteria bacterium]|nr:hypothetical protein [Candidatus Magasanikbacteria bacterium]